MASKRKIRRNSCLGKHRYASAKEARAAIHGLHQRKGFQGYMHAYYCDFCGGFHFGHPPKSRRSNRKYR